MYTSLQVMLHQYTRDNNLSLKSLKKNGITIAHIETLIGVESLRMSEMILALD